jgi:hypothetical protein
MDFLTDYGRQVPGPWKPGDTAELPTPSRFKLDQIRPHRLPEP